MNCAAVLVLGSAPPRCASCAALTVWTRPAGPAARLARRLEAIRCTFSKRGTLAVICVCVCLDERDDSKIFAKQQNLGVGFLVWLALAAAMHGLWIRAGIRMSGVIAVQSR